MKETNTKNEVGKKDKEVRKIPAFGGKGPSRIRQSFGRGLTIFLVIAACIILYFAFLRADTLFSVAGTIIEILKPIIYGFAIAYLLNPIVKETDKYLLPVLRKKIKKEKTARQFSRAAGILFALLVLFAVIFALLNMLIPELFHSIRNLMETLPGQLNSGIEAIENLQKEQSTMGLLLGNILNHASETLQNWIQTDLLRQMNIWMTNITTGAMNVLSEVFNFLVGCIVSVYMLFSKELFAAQMKKILYGVMSIEHANMTLHITRKSNEKIGRAHV